MKSAADIQLIASRPIPSLQPNQTSAGSVNATIPATTPAGVYWVIVCADAGNVVSELVETNNCATSANQVTVAP
jgi:hypothetical protein